jgi:hypothetical protein
MAKKKLKKISNVTAKKGFVSPMGMYMKYGDFDKSQVATGELTHRGRAYSEAGGDSITAYSGIARGQGYTAFRYGGKLYKINPTGAPPHHESKL